MKLEKELGKEYDVDGKKVIYAGEANKNEYFLSVEPNGAITEHIKTDKGVKRKTYTEGAYYDLLKHNLEDLK